MGLFDLLQQVVNASGALSAEKADRHFDDVVHEAPTDLLRQGVADTLRSDQTPPLGDLVAQMFGNASPQGRADMLNQILGSLGPAVLAGMAGGAGGSLLDKLLRGGAETSAGLPGGGAASSQGMPGGGLGGLFGDALGGGNGASGGLGSGGLGAILGGLGAVLGGAQGGSAGGGGALDASGGSVLPRVTPEQAERLSPDEVGRIAAEADKHDPSIVDALSGFYAQHPELVKTLGGAVLAFAMAKIHERMRQG